jgi:hypothetical protein
MITFVKKLAKKILGKMRNEDELFNLSVDEKQIINDIKDKKMTYLSEKKLGSIINTINEIENKEHDRGGYL